MLLTGFGSPYAIEAAALYLVAHSLFKGALFMVAGIIDHETGTRDVTSLRGLRTAMPLTFAAALAAAISMGGLPPFFGFLAKEEIYAALAASAIRDPSSSPSVAVLGNALMFAIGFAVGAEAVSSARPLQRRSIAHEAPLLLWLGPVAAGATGPGCRAFFATAAPLHLRRRWRPRSRSAGRVIEISLLAAYRRAAAALGANDRARHRRLLQLRPCASA